MLRWTHARSSEFEQRTGFRPPLLSEVLDWASGRIGLDVELKEDGYAEQVAPLLVDFAAAGNELIVTSFLDPLLGRVAQLAPALRLGLLTMWTAERAAERAAAAGARVVLPEMKLVTDPLIDATVSAGLELIVWDFMAARDGALLSDARIAGVITDDVAGALAVRAVPGAEPIPSKDERPSTSNRNSDRARARATMAFGRVPARCCRFPIFRRFSVPTQWR